MNDATDSAWYLDLDRHALREEFRTRYGDLDWRVQTHEVAIGRLMEATRYYPLRQVLGTDAADAYESVLGRVRIRLLRPGAFEGTVVGATSIVDIGTRSFTWCTCLFNDGVCFAVSEATQIAIDTDGKSRALSLAARTLLGRWLRPASPTSD
ncbi:hypothetical protein [Steroidobacter sp.]|uniref:hypothetical protein n=1 Tax=Steroidobacter sp. TaxID=1978227 RepID=UPI001A4AF47C|nr:hypothetical protein [Steroidobacter sp.]MBL8270070.1 hypothetical protein [Steroidobacter sp.]